MTPANAARKKQKRSLFRRAVAILTRVFVVTLLVSALGVLSLRYLNPPVSMVMLADDGRQQASWVPISDIPWYVQMAVIASEDQRFADHAGFDTRELKNAIDAARSGKRLRGASTLSQQAAKNLFLWHGRSLLRKGLEAALTLEMELLWPKARILEVYLNIAEFGPSVYGIEAGAEHHFGVSVAQLSLRQAALLASVLPAPKSYRAEPPDPHVLERAQWIERQIQQLGAERYLLELHNNPAP